MDPKNRKLDREIGKRIALLRAAHNKSQADIAGLLKVTQQQVLKYEKGINSLKADAIIALCHMLRTTPDELLGWTRGDLQKAIDHGGDAVRQLFVAIAEQDADYLAAVLKILRDRK